MYEYHGWATIRETYLNDDNFDEKIDGIIDKIQAEIDKLGLDNGLLDLRAVNGEYQLHLSGLLNHSGQRANDIYRFFEYISNIAIGSYGLLYVFDDEDMNGDENEFQVYKLAKGKFEKKKDTLLSPYIPVVEE
ncbi:MAG: immunity 7 family protein [Firmicutes bacterium]|nr:immunity 7 family protein [Bacillota bacterium]